MQQQGAVVEAAASHVLGSPSVAILVEPSKRVRVLVTTEQIFTPAYRTVGHSFPQSSVAPAPLADAAKAIGKHLAESAFIGARAMPLTTPAPAAA